MRQSGSKEKWHQQIKRLSLGAVSKRIYVEYLGFVWVWRDTFQ